MSLGGLTPVAVEGFSGLNLAADLEEVGFAGAINTINVELDPGRVRSRFGTSLWLATSNPIVAVEPFLNPNAGRYLIVAQTGSTGNIAAYRYDGTMVGTAANLAGAGLANPVSAQHVGTATNNFVYVTTGGTTMARFDWVSGAWTNPTMPAANVLGYSTDNRLVLGALSTGYSTVWFSDPGAPETFTTNNFVILNPGDGEQIMAMATWNNQLYVFKKSRYFVFYGTSTDATGQPVFNYRTVDTGIGAMSWHCAAAGRDGVYFLHSTGVYRTTGSVPTKVSADLEPFFTGTGRPSFLGGATIDPTRGAHVSYVKDRLYVQVEYGASAGVIVFVYHPQQQTWVAWTPPTTVPLTGRVMASEIQASSSSNSGTSTVLAAGSGVYRVDPTLSADNGTAFATAYQTGFSDLGAPAQEKTIRETEIVGSGTPRLAWARDFSAPDSPQSVSLGSTTSKRGLDRYARVGELLSFELSGAGPWDVRRVVPMLRETRGPGEETS